MRFDARIRATVFVCLAIFGLSTLATNWLIKALIAFFSYTNETGFEKPVFSASTLLLIAALTGFMIAFVSFRPVLAWIKERGLPGFVDAPDPFEGKHVRVALTVSEKGASWNEVFSQWVPAHYIRDLISTQALNAVTFVTKGGHRLALSRMPVPQEEGGGDTFTVKFKRGKRLVVHNLELTPGEQGTFESDTQENTATCYYALLPVGCEGREDPVAWLKFGGELRLMRLIFLAS